MKQVYIASPYSGDYEKNIKNTVEYCKLASECGVIGLAPHHIFNQWCDDRISEQRKKALKLGLALLEKCEELPFPKIKNRAYVDAVLGRLRELIGQTYVS